MATLDFHGEGLTRDDSAESTRRRRGPRSAAKVVLSTALAVAVTYTLSQPITVINWHVYRVAQLAQVSPRQAKRAIELARRTNALGALVLTEAVDKANVIRAAEETDPQESILITSIQFVSVGGSTAAVVTPRAARITVQFTVSGTDGYYDSGASQTDDVGQISFLIPSGAGGVRDTISVSAVLSGRTARALYTW